MPLLVLIVIAVTILIVVGRLGGIPRIDRRIGPAMVALLAAAGAFATGLRGMWYFSLALIAVSVWYGAAANRKAEEKPRSPAERMGSGQARAILGIAEGAGRAEVEAAYRRLMLRAHPDHGGSNGLAAQLNAARDCLLKKN